MFQITDGTFAEARRYCIHNHLVVDDGPWHDPRSCWFNALYTRVVPSDAVEMTAALLDRTVARTLESNRIAGTSLKQRQDLAAVIHLCGAGVGNAYARGGFRFRGDQRCGDHDVHRYLAQVNLLKRQFARLQCGSWPRTPSRKANGVLPVFGALRNVDIQPSPSRSLTATARSESLL